jgi:acyl-CoA thioesterase FadM
MFIGDPGRTSVGSYYEIWMKGKKYADGAAKMVWIDLATGRSVAVPETVSAALRAPDASRAAATHRLIVDPRWPDTDKTRR